MKRGEKNVDARAKCLAYIRRTNSLPAAQALARREGFTANFSVWIAALGNVLDGSEPPVEGEG